MTTKWIYYVLTDNDSITFVGEEVNVDAVESFPDVIEESPLCARKITSAFS